MHIKTLFMCKYVQNPKTHFGRFVLMLLLFVSCFASEWMRLPKISEICDKYHISVLFQSDMAKHALSTNWSMYFTSFSLVWNGAYSFRTVNCQSFRIWIELFALYTDLVCEYRWEKNRVKDDWPVYRDKFWMILVNDIYTQWRVSCKSLCSLSRQVKLFEV